MRKIELMYHLFGRGEPDTKCATCEHLVSYTANRKWYKCECYGETRSEASDWRLKYPSCGLYNMPYDWIPVIEYKKHTPRAKQEDQCKGQMRLEI